MSKDELRTGLLGPRPAPSFGPMRHSRQLTTLAALLALACGSAPPPAAGVGMSRPAHARRAEAEGVPALDAALLTRVPKGTFGPYVGNDSQQALLVWAAQEEAARAWFALGVDRHGRPEGEPHRVGAAPAEIGVVAVRSLGNDDFAVVSTRRGGAREQVEVMVLDGAGKVVGTSRRLGESASPVLWVDAARLGDRRIVLWAAQSVGGADVYALSISERGEPAGEVRKLAEGVRAWQAVVFGEQLALGVVRKSGPVEVLWIAKDGQFARSPTPIAPGSTAELDLDLCALGDRLIVLWSDRRFGEARLMAAGLAADGSVPVPAGPFTAPLGEQALLRVVASKERGYAVWENVSAPDGDGRSFEIATFGRDARASADTARVLYSSYDGSVPELAATPRGIALLTLAPACARKAKCESDESLPSFLALDDKLAPVAFEPVRLRALRGEAPDLGWGLTCLEGACFQLSAQNETPARVFLTELERKSENWQAPVTYPAREAPPRIVEAEVLAQTEPLAELAVASVGERKLFAWLTDFDPTTPWVRLKTPAADGRYDPLRATLTLGTFGRGRLTAAAPPLSLRAHSLAGIALAPGRNPDEAVLAWAGVDAGQPQVFLSRLGPDAAKRDQKMLTRKKGGVSDVGIAALSDGYVVGWLDERSGAPELMTAKVNPALVRVGSEQKLSRAGANPAELVLAANDAGALAVWSDAGGENRGDIFGLRLSSKDATALGSELRLSESVQHSFSPALCARGDRTVVAWLERADAGESAHAAMLGVLDQTGAWKEAPERITLTEGTPAALGLDCTAEYARVAVVVENGERAELVVFEHAGGRNSPAKSVLRLGQGTRSALRPVVAGDEIYLSEAGPDGDVRLRRLALVWR